MAQIHKGILGPVDGSIGTITGSSWKGIAYIKSQPSKRKSSSTISQIDAQLRFSVVQSFVQTLLGVIKLTFKKYATQMTESNAAFSYNYQNALTGIAPDYDIDYKKALVSRGELPNANAAQASVTGTGIYFTWEDNSGTGTAKGTDHAVLVVYCKNLNPSIFAANKAIRQEASATIDAVNFKGETVQTWLSFLSQDGEEASDSIYTGELTL